MELLEKMMECNFEMTVVRERYGDGYACFLTHGSESSEFISDTVTGGHLGHELTLHLEGMWYPYVTGSTIDESMKQLKEKIRTYSEGFTLKEYVLACEVMCGKMLDMNIHQAYHMIEKLKHSDVGTYLTAWESGTPMDRFV